MPTKPTPDAIALLNADHEAVQQLFSAFKALAESERSADVEKAALAEQICMHLSVHAQLEEEIFYPAVREAIDDDALMDEAEVEHATAKDLIADISSMHPGDALFDATVGVLREYVDHHVKQEQRIMFAKARRARLDCRARCRARGAQEGLARRVRASDRAPALGRRRRRPGRQPCLRGLR